MNIMQYNKAIVALIVPIVFFILNTVGITPDMQVSEAVTALIGTVITALLVWAIPNKK